MNKGAYQPHIDGLRAIAVALVIIYHTGLNILPGGFIGVDIFFVISGFLITGYICKAILTGQFKFGEFYMRRVRRLAPAFLVVSAGTFLLGLQFLLPEDLIYHTKLIGLSFLSLGNFYLANTTDSYFSRDVEEIPFLHTWSLSVEEQFYLLWPVILLFALKLAKRRIIYIATALLVASMVLSEWHAIADPNRAFYLITTRANELLIGALLALSLDRIPAPNRYLLSVLSWVSLFILLLTAAFSESSHEFLGISSIWVCLATAWLIYAGMYGELVTKLLGKSIFTGLGKISYSLYLWHWPLFAFYHYSIGAQSVGVAIVLTVVSVLLSILTWYYVEQPFRKARTKTAKQTILSLYAAPAIILVGLFLFVDKTDGVRFRFGENVEKIAAIESMPAGYEGNCSNDKDIDCRKIILIGDSHAQHIAPFFDKLISESDGLVLHSDAIPVCLPIEGVTQVFQKKNGTYRHEDHCGDNFNASINSIDASVAYFVMAAYWSNLDLNGSRNYLIDDIDQTLSRGNTLRVREDGIFRTVQLLLEKSVVPVLVIDIPELPDNILKCSHKRAIFGTVNGNCEMDFSEVLDQQSNVLQLFADIKAKYPQVIFIDPSAVFCNTETCKTEINGIPIYRDDDHINRVSSEAMGELYLNRVGNPFASKLFSP